MLRSVARRIVGPLVQRLLVNRSLGELPQPSGKPRVFAMGPDPDRVFIIGAAAVRGIGVVSHELGIGGHLARRLSALTGRGADVELLGVPAITTPAATKLLAEVDLGRFDALVVVLGGREAIGLRPVESWERDIRALIEHATGRVPTLSVFIVGVAPLSSAVPLSRLVGPMVGRHVTRLNAVSREICAAAGVSFVPLDLPEGRGIGDVGSTSTYVAWAEPIAKHMHGALDAAAPNPRDRGNDEELRQAALDAMDIVESPPTAELDSIARVAKDLFGVLGAAVNLIDRDRQLTKAAWGIEQTDLPRSDSFCSATVELGGALVSRDTRLDPRLNHLAAVRDGILFYAGYPVEAPNGQRVGTLCLFDTEPRGFTSADESLLRQLALRVQAELWSHGSVPAR